VVEESVVKAVRTARQGLAALLAAGVVLTLYLLVLSRGSWPPWSIL
jgi:hypothetical protein